MNSKYILKDHTPILCSGLLEWAKWFETANRKVDNTELPNDVQVSTVFLGLDHSFGGKPLLFETMVFGGKFDQDMTRYATWDEAQIGHNKMVEKAKAG